MMTGTIYLLIFHNAKFYVGQAKRLGRRLRQHAHEARKGSALPVHAAWRKYGRPVALVMWEGPLEDLDAREVELIQALSPAYNIAAGGSQGHTRTPEFQERMKAALQSRSAIWRENVRRRLRERNSSPEHMAKLRIRTKQRRRLRIVTELIRAQHHEGRINGRIAKGYKHSPDALARITASSVTNNPKRLTPEQRRANQRKWRKDNPSYHLSEKIRAYKREWMANYRAQGAKTSLQPQGDAAQKPS